MHQMEETVTIAAQVIVNEDLHPTALLYLNGGLGLQAGKRKEEQEDCEESLHLILQR